MMKILHTEASPGMGGQEIRILRESIGMRKRGHQVIFAIQKGGELATRARAEGFIVYELSFKKINFIPTLFKLLILITKHRIDILNTHSSTDAWIGGCAAKLAKVFTIRTRHLSTPIRKGFNSKILYNFLADFTVTTCTSAKEMIQCQARLPSGRLASIPTGIDPADLHYDSTKVMKFRESLGLGPDDVLIGTLCVLRGWKGVHDFLQAAKLLEEVPNIKWIVVGGGVSEEYYKGIWKELGLEKKVFFTGHLDPPFTALAAMDLFLLLSFANEGVSQASLQAAWLKKALVTTRVGGLGEVCLDGVTGIQVDVKSPAQVAEAVLQLVKNQELRTKMGESAHALVRKRFTFDQMLDEMEQLYSRLEPK